MAFENRGKILRFDPEQALQYTHLSALSELPDEPQSYTTIGFDLASLDDRTSVHLAIENFPAETIFKHLDFYWRVTLEVLKRFVEHQSTRRVG